MEWTREMEEKKANVRLEALRIYYGWKLRHDFRRPIRFGLQKKKCNDMEYGALSFNFFEKKSFN